ncbi:MAG: HNH endonuclease [Planctomycetaceae bacterium]|jgi:hypothetical protein|nr:HNH endonuclease [Planctomycetaceae bacterium]MBT6155265.1 HNH endonuclease [Planctomycetaceae bacterium]MBT6485239.1 HNH endonuclease [Planctomycetaceae bacterium]MBT6497428.1 HNH endonuclease [Planctomycetaceae bacterium]
MVAAVLERPTLVLNRNWQPVGVVPVTKALTKAWNDTARIVDPADYQQHTWDNWMQIPAEGELFIQTRFTRLRVPEVITLTNYDRLPTNSVTFSRRNVFKRDRFTCQYCGVQPGSDELTIDHVVPRAQGGTSTWKNCVLACIACNGRKADRTPQQAKMPLRSQPERPLWRPLYSSRGVRIESWSRFVSESYWNVELKE